LADRFEPFLQLCGFHRLFIPRRRFGSSRLHVFTLCIRDGWLPYVSVRQRLPVNADEPEPVPFHDRSVRNLVGKVGDGTVEPDGIGARFK